MKTVINGVRSTKASTEICEKCGDKNNLSHFGTDYHSDAWCFACNFWQKRITERDEKAVVIVDGWHYTDGGPGGGKYAGFGGRKFIYVKDGEIRSTTNMWSQGPIPEVFRAELPDNARWADGHEKEWVKDREGTLHLVSVMEAEWPREL